MGKSVVVTQNPVVFMTMAYFLGKIRVLRKYIVIITTMNFSTFFAETLIFSTFSHE